MADLSLVLLAWSLFAAGEILKNTTGNNPAPSFTAASHLSYSPAMGGVTPEALRESIAYKQLCIACRPGSESTLKRVVTSLCKCLYSYTVSFFSASILGGESLENG